MSSSQVPQFNYDSLAIGPGEIKLFIFRKRKSLLEDTSLEFIERALLPARPTLNEAAASREYATLSYTWGESTSEDMRTICVNGGTFEVGPNLALALQCLEEYVELPIWIDALCINQQTTSEKADKVSQMDQFYKHSAREIIFR